MNKKIPPQVSPSKCSVKNATQLSEDTEYCSLNFRYLKAKCITQKDFNNHFRDETHYLNVISSFIGTVLPKISELKPNELLSGSRFSKQFHFHRVERDKYEKIRSILKEYSFNDRQIDQFLDGERIFQFAGNLEGHQIESRVICEYINGVLFVLFFDTNHHLYFNKSKVGESLAYSCCPYEMENKCFNAYNCFAKDFLDTNKLDETYGYTYSHA